MGDDGLPGDLQSLSWLTAVDVPRLQQMASGRIDLGSPGAPHPHPGRLKQGRWPWPPARGVLEAPVALTSLLISVKWEQVHTSLVIRQAEEDTWDISNTSHRQQTRGGPSASQGLSWQVLKWGLDFLKVVRK